MSQSQKPHYPDISDLLSDKAAVRQARSQRTFGEKIAAMERLRKNVAPFKRLREERAAALRQSLEREG